MKALLRALGISPRLKRPVKVTRAFRKSGEWIASVEHDKDGAWAFHDHVYDKASMKWVMDLADSKLGYHEFSKAHPSPDPHYVQMELDELLALDLSLQEIVESLQPGWYATRESPNGFWKKEKDDFIDEESA